MNWKSSDGVLKFDELSDNWNEITEENQYMKTEILGILSKSSNVEFRAVEGDGFSALEYILKLNVFSFAKFMPKVNIKIKVIGLPVSIGKQGFCGDFNKLKDYYKNRKGLFLVLNIEDEKHSKFQTLPTCIFHNKFNDFNDYVLNLRSPYRRRMNIAFQKGENLIIGKVENQDFDDRLYDLYIQVLNNSDYPLERQSKEFFYLKDLDIYAFYKNNVPIAFVSTVSHNNTLGFVFGGMDYSKRDKYDLYYNMLLFILKKGIDEKIETIDFGQTAEQSKLRLGCELENRYIMLLHKKIIINKFLTPLTGLFEYKYNFPAYRVFNKTKDKYMS